MKTKAKPGLMEPGLTGIGTTRKLDALDFAHYTTERDSKQSPLDCPIQQVTKKINRAEMIYKTPPCTLAGGQRGAGGVIRLGSIEAVFTGLLLPRHTATDKTK